MAYLGEESARIKREVLRTMNCPAGVSSAKLHQ
jgi:hypothetical protein